jgi:hypothetical protein
MTNGSWSPGYRLEKVHKQGKKRGVSYEMTENIVHSNMIKTPRPENARLEIRAPIARDRDKGSFPLLLRGENIKT